MVKHQKNVAYDYLIDIGRIELICILPWSGGYRAKEAR